MERKNPKEAEKQSLSTSSEPEKKQEDAERQSVLKQGQKSELKGNIIIQDKAAEHFRNGKEAMEKSQYEKAVICFSKAINLQPEETQLHVNQAESYLQLCDFQSAAACYQRAWRLEPEVFSDRLAFIYYLQGQCLFDRRLFSEALEVFTKAAEVKPGCRAHQVRSLACLSAAGQHVDCLKLLNHWMVSDAPTSDLYVLRARLYKRLHQTTKCHQDVKAALALNPSCPHAKALLQQLQEDAERARKKAVDKLLSGRLPEALLMINVALQNCPQDPHLYLFRGILYRRLRDFTAAIEDLVMAVELKEKEEEEEKEEEKEEEEKEVREEEKEVREEEKEVREEEQPPSLQQEAQLQLVLTYNDFAVQCFGRGLYAEATLLLNKAIEEEKEEACLFLNRGDCFFKQAEWCFALADYQQAEEMMAPHEPALRLRLAVIHNKLGSLCFQDGRFQEAADMFSLAIKYKPGASGYYESRAKALRKLLDLEAAQKDLIRLMILDPTNDEIPAMLMSLFPRCRESQVLSSPLAQSVRVQLMETIQACSSSSNQQSVSLSEKLQAMSLTSQSEEASGSGEDLKLCLNKEEMKIFMKSLMQSTGRVSDDSS